MRKPLLVTVLVILVLVAGVTTATTWAAQAVATKLTASDADAAPIVSIPSGDSASPADSSSLHPAVPAPVSPSYIVHRLKSGESLITDVQIDDYYLAQPPSITGDLANTMLAVHEGQIEVRCMADKGWWYDPRYRSGLASGSPEARALDGSTGAGDAYRWQDAGCYGLAVHETGATD